MLDFSAIPMFENHTHGLDPEKTVYAPLEYWPFYLHGIKEGIPFGKDTASDMILNNSVNLGLSKNVIKLLSDYLQCEANPEAVLDARNKKVSQIGAKAYSWELYKNANIVGTVVDMPWPINDPLESYFGCPAYRLYRVDPLIDSVIASHASFDEALEEFEAKANAAIDSGYIGFKAHPGERHSFAVYHVTLEEARRAFQTKENAKSIETLYYALFARLLKLCEKRESIVHVHSGNSGGPLNQQDLIRCNPMLMIPFLNDPAYRCVPIAFLHGDYPDIRVASEMSHMYPNVYVDLSWVLPWAGLEFNQILRSALAIAPHNKILLGSGQNHVPEFAWAAAKVARKALESVLGEYVADDMLSREQAVETAEMLLYRNAYRLYHLS